MKRTIDKGIRSKLITAFLVVFVCGTALTGCGTKSDDNGDTGIVNGSETGSEANTPDTDDSAANADTNEKRIVETLRGDVEIPANPQRIVDVSGISDIFTILGYKPIATGSGDSYNHNEFPSYLKELLDGSLIVGFSMVDTVDIEGILSVEPDLIIINPRQEKAFEQLNAIATTIIIEPDVNDWRGDMRMAAKLLNKEAEADEYIKAYDENVKAAGERIKEANGADATYFAFLASGSDYYMFTGAAYGDIFYNDMGLAVPDNLPEQDSITLPMTSLEGLTDIEADYMIVLASDDDKAVLEASSVWNNMKAVKEGNVIWLPTSPYFNQAYSTYGRTQLVDELEQLMTSVK